MKIYDIVAFDLDGTLTDPSGGLINSFVYGLKRMGVDYGDKESLKRFIGPPIFEQWQKDFAFTPEQSQRAVDMFREYYSVYGWWDNKIYDGVSDMLQNLKQKGKIIVLATSKPEHFAKRILDLFNISRYFDFIGGATEGQSRIHKKDVLAYSLKNVGYKEGQNAILVGDRKFDAEGAALCGIDALGVTYGHGSLEELMSAGFVKIVSSAKEIADFLI